MLAWTRSLMKRDWLSSRYSPGQLAQQVIVERGPALGAAARGLPLERLHQLRDRLDLLGDDQPADVVVAEVGARAHRLHRGRIVGVAELRLEQLLDQPGAGTAGGRRLGVRADVVERLEAEPRDRAGDLALAHAVAAADLRVVGQRGDGRRRVERNAALVALAEDQRLAHLGDVDAALEEIEEPGAVGRCRRT